MAYQLKDNMESIDILFEGYQNGKQQQAENEILKEAWHDLIQAKRENIILEGILTAVESHKTGNKPNDKQDDNKKKELFGVVSYKNVRGYIPLSEFPAQNKRHISSYAGIPVSFKVSEIQNEEDSYFMASRKQAMEHMKNYFDKVAENGKSVKAFVNDVNDRRVRINVGGYEIFLPISDMGFGWIRDLHSMVQTGDIMNVLIQDKGKDGEAPTVSRKAALKNPFPECLKRYQPGGQYVGVITGFNNYGAFVNLEQGVDTLATADFIDSIYIGDRIIIQVKTVKKIKGTTPDTPPDQKYRITSDIVRKV